MLITLAWFQMTGNMLQAQDSASAKKIKVLPVPSFGYSPETSTYVGAVVLFTFKTARNNSTRTSNAKLEFTYTWNKQLIFESGWNYFFNEESWFTKGQLSYSKYPDLYYGVGPNTPDSNKLNFSSNRFNVEVFALKKIGKHLFTGLNLKHTDYANIEYAPTRLAYPELRGSAVSGIGFSVLKDSRNSLLTPASGVYMYLNSGFNYANTNYWEGTLDLRYYISRKTDYTLATRLVNTFNSGEPPFFAYAFLGGDRYVRGYYYGRYRSNNLSALQSEFRFRLFWRFGLAAFGGLGLNYPDFSHIDPGNSRYNYGMGLRFLVDKNERTNLRLDYALGQNGNNGFYVSFGESF